MKSKFFVIVLGILWVSVFFSVFSQEQEEKIPVLTFKDTPIREVFQSLGAVAGVNIVASPEVSGTVTLQLKNVTWEEALDIILKTYGLGKEYINNNIIIMPLKILPERRELESTVVQGEPLETRIYRLKYLDARDVKKVLESQLTPKGKITALEIEPPKGWRARGGFEGEFEKAEREAGARIRANTLIITDTQSKVRELIKRIEEMDVKPRQVLIEAKIMEVNEDVLKDLGFDWGTGGSVHSGTLTNQPIDKSNGKVVGELGVINLSSQKAPSVFGPKADLSGTWPFDAGLSLLYKKLTGTQFEVILHALEEDVHTNLLSAPRILTLDGQEAYIMVGERRPIIKSSIESSDTSVGISKSLDYYQNLGIEFNVVPQICEDDNILLNIYPSVTSSSQNVPAESQIGETTTTDYYPIILVREAQSQILLKDGETVVIGGLLKDIKSKSVYKTPILGDIPLLGNLFQRKTTDTEKIDLLIFITAKIVKEGEFTPQNISQYQDRLSTLNPKKERTK